jgi:hypothetical protein
VLKVTPSKPLKVCPASLNASVELVELFVFITVKLSLVAVPVSFTVKALGEALSLMPKVAVPAGRVTVAVLDTLSRFTRLIVLETLAAVNVLVPVAFRTVKVSKPTILVRALVMAVESTLAVLAASVSIPSPALKLSAVADSVLVWSAAPAAVMVPTFSVSSPEPSVMDVVPVSVLVKETLAVDAEASMVARLPLSVTKSVVIVRFAPALIFRVVLAVPVSRVAMVEALPLELILTVSAPLEITLPVKAFTEMFCVSAVPAIAVAA